MSRKRRQRRRNDANGVRPVGGDGPAGPLPSAVQPGGLKLEEIAAADAAASREAGGELIAAARALFAPRSPLLPHAGATGAPMTAAIAVMSALAALALAGFLMIAMAADRWTDDLAESMTIQVKGLDDAEIAARTEIAVSVLKDFEGVSDIKVRPPEEAAALLRPWLGDSAASYLAIPALIDIRADAPAREALPALRARLAGASPGLGLDDHGQWNDSLMRAALAGQSLTFGVFLLVTLAACSIAAFAASAGLAANADVVSLLHLVGATDDFIAGEMQRRFLVLGVRGSLIGVAIAALAVAILSLVARTAGADSYFLPSFEAPGLLFAPMALVPVAISLATSITARTTVLRSLTKEI